MLLQAKRKVASEIDAQAALNTVPSRSEDKSLLMLLRTVYISLSYLGHVASADEYINLLLTNKHFDKVNRGFHLEYYEDIKFNASSPENLRHDDNLGSFTKTFAILYRKIVNSLADEVKHNMFEVELYTLCSLAQHRFIEGKLGYTEKNIIAQLINQTLRSKLVVSELFFKYLNFLNYVFTREGFSKGTLINDLYGLKTLKRSGWVDRKVNDGETVADHMYGTFLLGFVHLPEKLHGFREYNKDKILKMLLTHDLAEAYVGDLLPREKNSETERRELEFIHHIGFFSTYEGVSNLLDVVTLYEEFSKGNDLNARIARDIDKLENLMQLMIYKHMEPHHNFKDFETFKRDLINHVETDEGRRIRAIILDHFKE